MRRSAPIHDQRLLHAQKKLRRQRERLNFASLASCYGLWEMRKRQSSRFKLAALIEFQSVHLECVTTD